MAYRLVVKKQFADNVEQVYKYLYTEWGSSVALKFLNLIELRLAMLKEHPYLGATSYKIKNVRSISVIKHNRLFYKIEAQTVVILYLKDTRQRNYFT